MADTAVYQVRKLIYEMRESAPVRTFMGVEGELNGKTSFNGGSNTEDPHHGDPADESYQPIIYDCRTDSEIKKCLKDFAKTYEANTKTWSWRFEFGNNCHSFQIEMITHCDLNNLKEI